MWKARLLALSLIFLGIIVGFFDYESETNPDSILARFPFKLGLDLKGGTHLVYQADLRDITFLEVRDSMDALRDVIERRVNIFGVSEPVVQTEMIGATQDKIGRLIVELPGVTDVDQAIAMIGATPLLDFRVERPVEEIEALFNDLEGGGNSEVPFEDIYVLTELSGRYLERATLGFDSITGEPLVLLDFDKEGTVIFHDITRDNLGKSVAIYLDGAPISAPIVQAVISNGQAQITGNFTKEEARTLVGRLNSGALPIPISLLSTQTIGGSLGARAVEQGIRSGIIGLVLVATFFIFWYRLPGILAVISLGIYLVLMLALFKLIPVTLTAAGVAGFILTIGLAVDANILIFERIKEELAKQEQENNRARDRQPQEDVRPSVGGYSGVSEPIRAGFSRAWLSIRDANLSSIITAVVLFWFGTSLIKGFALTFGIGVLVSMFSAIVVTRSFMFALGFKGRGAGVKFLLGSGMKN